MQKVEMEEVMTAREKQLQKKHGEKVIKAAVMGSVVTVFAMIVLRSLRS